MRSVIQELFKKIIGRTTQDLSKVWQSNDIGTTSILFPLAYRLSRNADQLAEFL